jgi:putative FmdB family regulatory protein
MPTYSYKCPDCESISDHFLPMSTDPEKKMPCPACFGAKSYRVITRAPMVNGLKVFAGDWFKKTYGHELGEDGMTALEKKKDFESLMDQVKKEQAP